MPQGSLEDGEPEPQALVVSGPHWTLFFDGSMRKQGAGVGVLLLSLDGEQFKYMVHLDFKATNNMAEYEAPHFRAKYRAASWGLTTTGEGRHPTDHQIS
jgi:hypothetical protein